MVSVNVTVFAAATLASANTPVAATVTVSPTTIPENAAELTSMVAVTAPS